MFEQSFVRPRSRVRTGWTVLVSTGLQAVGLSAAVIIPLMNPELLPRVVADAVNLAPPGPPPGRPPVAAGAERPRALSRRPAPPGFYEPAAVPRTVAHIEDEPAADSFALEGGVPGGVPQAGETSAVLTSIIRAANTPAPVDKPAAVAAPEKPAGIQRIIVGGNVQQGLLIDKTQPIYPQLAIQARIQGTVVLRGIIGPDGRVRELVVVSGHPMLVQAAVAAVGHWRYKPTLLNGQPVEVVAPIEVHFTLGR